MSQPSPTSSSESPRSPEPNATERKALWEGLPKPKMEWDTFKRMFGIMGDANKCLCRWRRKQARLSK
jgi:hypothetical protein